MVPVGGFPGQSIFCPAAQPLPAPGARCPPATHSGHTRGGVALAAAMAACLASLTAPFTNALAAPSCTPMLSLPSSRTGGGWRRQLRWLPGWRRCFQPDSPAPWLLPPACPGYGCSAAALGLTPALTRGGRPHTGGWAMGGSLVGLGGSAGHWALLHTALAPLRTRHLLSSCVGGPGGGGGARCLAGHGRRPDFSLVPSSAGIHSLPLQSLAVLGGLL